MVTLLLSQFSSMTLLYFNYSIVTKIDLVKEDKHINYYTFLKEDNWLSTFNTFMSFNCNCSYYNSDYIMKVFDLSHRQQVYSDYCTIQELLNVLIELNMTKHFYNYYPFYKNRWKKFRTSDAIILDHIHQGYIVKNIYTSFRLKKFWTYNLNRTINKKLKVKLLLSSVIIFAIRRFFHDSLSSI